MFSEGSRHQEEIIVTGTNGKTSVADFFYQILNLNSNKLTSIDLSKNLQLIKLFEYITYTFYF
mgnify:CR=1 FL=1